MSEFYGLTQTILRPDVSLQKLKANGERHPNWQRMESFVKNFGSRFNKSQGEALQEVVQMVENQILLI